MAFLFKSRKSQAPPSGLPQATRNISSSQGPSTTSGSMLPAANGEKRGDGSLNGSLNSLQNEPTGMAAVVGRQRAESDISSSRPSGRAPPPGGSAPSSAFSQLPPGMSAESPYPWSQRRLNFAANNPFPRYGAAVNAVASKEGFIYLMGGLINGATVKGDLWMVESGALNPNNPQTGDKFGSMECYPVPTRMEGPGPRVGHASLLVGNAFIVFGGDTKVEEGDVLDDTLYLLNTATKQWSRALPSGTRPAGRYGHTLNLLGSKIYIFGGQVEGFFFNDLVAFDLNQLQNAGNRWETLIPSGDVDRSGQRIPPARTNHSIVAWNDRLYLFGGTDGTTWFNDVWTYHPGTNSWTELDCIGYIPAAREGHAAALVNDTMYIFGGRVQEGSDLGDLAAFKISSRRWYMFQNMGMSPSPRSGHSMTSYGKHIVVLGGEPSSAPRDVHELSVAYILDTSKIRYPASDPPSALPTAGGNQGAVTPQRKFSGSDAPPGPQGPQAMRGIGPPPSSGIPQPQRSPPSVNGASPTTGPGSRLPQPSGRGPPPQQQSQQHQQAPRVNGVLPAASAGRRTPTRSESDPKSSPELSRTTSAGTAPSQAQTSRQGSRSNSRLQRAQGSVDSVDAPEPTARGGPGRPSIDAPSTARSGSRAEHGTTTPAPHVDESGRPGGATVDSGIGSYGSSPALSQDQTALDAVQRELEKLRTQNAWYASELALARKSGYTPSTSEKPHPSLSPAADRASLSNPDALLPAIADEDRPLVEVLLRMRAELSRVQQNVETQAARAAARIAAVEKQRDGAVGEAMYARAKLASMGVPVSTSTTPVGDRDRSTSAASVGRSGGSGAGTPTMLDEQDRVTEMGRRLAAALAAQKEAATKAEGLLAELEAERRARASAEEMAGAAQARVTELDAYRQRTVGEVEGLRAELHEAMRAAREEGARAAEALGKEQLTRVELEELSGQMKGLVGETAAGEAVGLAGFIVSLREAVTESGERAELLESRLQEERALREEGEAKIVRLKSELEERAMELESLSRKARDAEILAERHAGEAEKHRRAVSEGLDRWAASAGLDAASTLRITALQSQVDAANALVQQNLAAAGAAEEKLRRAEERIAGLESYQEQASRENLHARKQLQAAMREVQTLQAEKGEAQATAEKQMLESNALEVQLRTLKALLEERGASAAEMRRSRILDRDSPSGGAGGGPLRLGTPDVTRVRELEGQLEQAGRAHEELRATFERREQEVQREWEEKLAALDSDHQAAARYVRGIEKMLAKMKSELTRVQHRNAELEKEAGTRGASGAADAAGAEQLEESKKAWEAERAELQKELTALQTETKSTISGLEGKLQTLEASLATAEAERAQLSQSAADAAAAHEARIQELTAQSTADLERLRHENGALEARARDAEHRVQLFLDQFESSVDNYRRMSRLEGMSTVGGGSGALGHLARESISADSVYSTDDAADARDEEGSGEVTPSAAQFPTIAEPAGTGPLGHARDRSSTALDSLASELDALRTQWETTNKAYRLSDRFEFDGRTPTFETPGFQWGSRLGERAEEGGAVKEEGANGVGIATGA